MTLLQLPLGGSQDIPSNLANLANPGNTEAGLASTSPRAIVWKGRPMPASWPCVGPMPSRMLTQTLTAVCSLNCHLSEF